MARDNRTNRRSGRALEDEVCDLFSSAGCAATPRAKVKGARGDERVDVWVKLRSLGLPDYWAVECKDQKTAVVRGDVQTFQVKVGNVGASRGIMVSTSGYQRGCTATAAKTNIMLTSLSKLTEVLDMTIGTERLKRMAPLISDLADRLRDMEKQGELVPGKVGRRGLVLKRPTGNGSELYAEYTPRVEFVRDELKAVLAGQARYHMPSEEEDPFGEDVLSEVVPTLKEFCDRVQRFQEDMERWASGLIPPD